MEKFKEKLMDRKYLSYFEVLISSVGFVAFVLCLIKIFTQPFVGEDYKLLLIVLLFLAIGNAWIMAENALNFIVRGSQPESLASINIIFDGEVTEEQIVKAVQQITEALNGEEK